MIAGSSVLTDIYAPIRDELGLVERQIERELTCEEPFVNELCRHVERYRGKMLRPALLLLSGRACGAVIPAHRTLGAVVEIVHLATLVHDDVLDQAEVRRRRRTVNVDHGNEAAVLLGDYLISHAYHLCSSLNDPSAARAIAQTTNTVCEGELIQVHLRNRADLTEAKYFEIIRKKTASLTGVCCALGARYAGAGEAAIEAMNEFGIRVGIAFQVVDDVLDLVGAEKETGKTIGRDLDLGKATLPMVHAMGHCATDDAACLRRLIEGRDSPSSMEDVRGWLEAAGSLEYALSLARDNVHSAIAQLERLPESPARDSLTTMAEFIIERRF